MKTDMESKSPFCLLPVSFSGGNCFYQFLHVFCVYFWSFFVRILFLIGKFQI